MSHYNDLSDEGKIKIARDAVRCRVPIAPAVASWLHEQGLHDRIVNPRRSNADNEAEPS